MWVSERGAHPSSSRTRGLKAVGGSRKMEIRKTNLAISGIGMDRSSKHRGTLKNKLRYDGTAIWDFKARMRAPLRKDDPSSGFA